MKPGTFNKLKEQEKEARKGIIIEAAEREFASRPFHKVNMRNIAKKAGISAASIYRYFPDQQSLFVEVFARGTKDIFQKLEDIASRSERGAIEEIADAFIDYFTRNDQYFRMLMKFFLEGLIEEDVFLKLTNLERALLDTFDRIFIKMYGDNQSRIDSHAFFASLVGIVATFRNHPSKSEDDTLRHRKRVAAHIASLYIDNKA